MRSLLFSLLFFTISWAHAGGGWISSGGGLFRDAHNPWFLKNVDKVYYCLEVDEPTFSIPLVEIRKEVQTSFQYWKSQFEKSRRLSADALVLGGQEFLETQCDDPQLHLSFHFGYGTLSEEQVEHLKDPTRFIGVATRTSYDEKTLTGRGFIYISSDQGPKAFDNPGTLIKQAWSKPNLLRYALLHELGHVFGLPHSGNGLMAEVFLDHL
ncbi:MAG: hypothetical protein AAF203_08255, partial [Pseudomonadota bacterium]